MPLVCEKCGVTTRSVVQQQDEDVKGQIWCKPCHRDRKFSGRFDVATHIRPDTYPGGPITLENYGAKPVTFSSESERVAYVEKNELHLKERWCPFPGTDRDPAGVQNPEGYVDKQTLDNRAELFLRANNSQKKEDTDVSDVLVHTFEGHLTNRDAVAMQTQTDTKRLSRLFRRTSKVEDGK
jgi:hypothetical protein